MNPGGPGNGNNGGRRPSDPPTGPGNGNNSGRRPTNPPTGPDRSGPGNIGAPGGERPGSDGRRPGGGGTITKPIGPGNGGVRPGQGSNGPGGGVVRPGQGSTGPGGVVRPGLPGRPGGPDRGNPVKGPDPFRPGGERQRPPTRSGTVNYGSNSNRYGTTAIRIQRPVAVSLGVQRINEQERIRLIVNGYRNGYCAYNRGWRDDFFCYPWYVFNPWQFNRFVCSPWYYYSCLPPYLNYDRVIIVNVHRSRNWYGNPYRWHRPVYSAVFTVDNRYESSNDSYTDLDYAVDDLARAFEQTDYKAMNNLLPTDGKVDLYFDGNYGYSLNAPDFYDLFADGVENVKTSRYTITNVRYDSRDSAKVSAIHEFTDAWGNPSTTYQDFFLVKENGKWTVREFGTSNTRTNW